MLLGGALIIAIIGGMFIFSYLKQAEYRDFIESGGAATPDDSFTVSRLDAKHYYTQPQGVHTIAGEIVMPTACDLLTYDAVLLDDGKRARIYFDVINNSDEVCAQVQTPQRFKVGFAAPEDIQIEAVFKNMPIELNLIPAGPGETPADFELFIKG